MRCAVILHFIPFRLCFLRQFFFVFILKFRFACDRITTAVAYFSRHYYIVVYASANESHATTMPPSMTYTQTNWERNRNWTKQKLTVSRPSNYSNERHSFRAAAAAASACPIKLNPNGQKWIFLRGLWVVSVVRVHNEMEIKNQLIHPRERENHFDCGCCEEVEEEEMAMRVGHHIYRSDTYMQKIALISLSISLEYESILHFQSVSDVGQTVRANPYHFMRSEDRDKFACHFHSTELGTVNIAPPFAKWAAAARMRN